MAEHMDPALAAALAEIRGELKGLRETTEIRVAQTTAELEREASDAATERGRLEDRIERTDDRLDGHHHRIDSLEAVKDRMWGGAAVIGFVSGSIVAAVFRLLG